MPSQHPPELATVGDVHRALDERHAYLLLRFESFRGAVMHTTAITRTILREYCQSAGIDFDRRDESLDVKARKDIRVLMYRMARKISRTLIKLSGAYNPEEN